jgi:hypothetical protein
LPRPPRTEKDTCSKCRGRNWKRKKNTSARGYSLVCRPCTSRQEKEWRSRNKEKVKEYDEEYNNANRKVYGTARKPREDYVALAREFGERCGICGRKEKGKRLAVDHDHRTGRVRGLLCGKCNTALGLFGDSVEVLEKAKGYLDGRN